MRKVALLTVLLLFLSGVGFGEEGFTPDQLQSRFAESLKDSVPDVQGAVWRSHIDLWVQTTSTDKNRAKGIATDVIAKGMKDLGQMFCVHVHSGDWKELSKMCWTY